MWTTEDCSEPTPVDTVPFTVQMKPERYDQPAIPAFNTTSQVFVKDSDPYNISESEQYPPLSTPAFTKAPGPEKKSPGAMNPFTRSGPMGQMSSQDGDVINGDEMREAAMMSTLQDLVGIISGSIDNKLENKLKDSDGFGALADPGSLNAAVRDEVTRAESSQRSPQP